MYSLFPPKLKYTHWRRRGSFLWFKNKWIWSQCIFYPTKVDNCMGNEFAKGCNKRAFGLRVFWSPEKLGCFLRSTSRTNFISFLERVVFLDLSFYYLSLYWNCKRCILLKNYEPQHSWFKDRLWLERVWLLQLRDGNFIPVLPFQHGLCTKKTLMILCSLRKLCKSKIHECHDNNNK